MLTFVCDRLRLRLLLCSRDRWVEMGGRPDRRWDGYAIVV